jgi:hypothetical protein
VRTVKLVRREKWNRGDSLGPSPGFDCQSTSQCNNAILTGEEIAKNDGDIGEANKDSISVEPATQMLPSD